MSSTERKELPEAPASATARVKSKKGFSWLFTLRGTSGTELVSMLEKFEEDMIAREWTPIEDATRGGFPQKPAAPTKPCEFHQGALLKQKIMPDGKELWSHSKGVYPNLTYCNGQGFPEERGPKRETYEGGY